MTGVVKKLEHERGFGFVRDPKSGTEYFFHYTALPGKLDDFKALTVGQQVTFEVDPKPNDKGPRVGSLAPV